MNGAFAPLRADAVYVVQCGATVLELALCLLEAGDELSASAVLTEGIALLGDATPQAIRTLHATLQLTTSLNDQGYYELFGHQISISIDGPPNNLAPHRWLLN